MSIIPIAAVINVTIENTPRGLTEPNVNSVACFTTEHPDSLDPYTINIAASQVAEIYGTNSVAAAMANAVFSQSPNILSGSGQLVMIPLIDSVSATSGNFVTPNISANLATLIAVTAGDIKITVDGVAYNITNLNFTNCATLIDIAAVIQAKIINATITANATIITIRSKKAGATSTVTIATYAGGGTDLYGATYLHGATGTSTGGADSTGETIPEAIARTSGQVFYAMVISDLVLEDDAIEDTAAAIQALDMMYFNSVSSTADIAGIGTTIQQATETKTRILLYTPGLAQANLEKAAYVGRGCSVDFSGSNTASTMMLKTLATITPDLGISLTNYEAAKVAGVDLFVSFYGVPGVLSTGGNDYFDNQYANLALKFALETAGFNYLAQTNTKVPQTEPGMNGLKAAYAAVMERFVVNGTLAPGEWNSSETFGDPQLFRANITQKGYYIFSTPVAQQSSDSRNLREAPLVQIACKRAGAIQSSDVIVIVNA